MPVEANLYLPAGGLLNLAVGDVPDDTALIGLRVKAAIRYRYQAPNA